MIFLAVLATLTVCVLFVAFGFALWSMTSEKEMPFLGFVASAAGLLLVVALIVNGANALTALGAGP